MQCVADTKLSSLRIDLLRALVAAALCVIVLRPFCSDATPSVMGIDAFFRPYVATNNFSGSVVIWHPTQDSPAVFLKSYGYADRAKRIPNTPTTRFHVASLSIMFTTTAVLRLIDQGKLTLDTYPRSYPASLMGN